MGRYPARKGVQGWRSASAETKQWASKRVLRTRLHLSAQAAQGALTRRRQAQATLQRHKAGEEAATRRVGAGTHIFLLVLVAVSKIYLLY